MSFLFQIFIKEIQYNYHKENHKWNFTENIYKGRILPGQITGSGRAGSGRVGSGSAIWRPDENPILNPNNAIPSGEHTE